MGKTKTLKKYTTSLTADCVEFCPAASFEDFLICGNYQLESPEVSRRIGNISLHSVANSTLNPLSKVDTDAVLDLKFRKCTEELQFCSVESTGFFRLWGLSESQIKPLFSKLICADEILLSCDWNENKCIVSTSGGNLCLLDVSSETTVTNEWHCHDHEAWIAAFDGADKNIVYSGGDDCCLRKHDLRMDLGRGQLVGRRGMMGKTSVQSHPIQTHLFASGSYDETVSLWDARQSKAPLQEISVGGGAWRLKWEPCSGSYLLVGAMHNGFQILSFVDQTLKPVGSYMEHASLAYGCDWHYGGRKDAKADHVSEIPDDQLEPVSPDGFLVATCSMYDKALHTWLWLSEGD